MIIKVCGMREAQNIHDVAKLGIDWLGLVFIPSSERFVRQVSSRAGIIPDYGSMDSARGKQETNEALKSDKRVQVCGIFKDDMPQNIVTRVVNFNLDIVQLNGSESPVMIDNLRRTLDPDIHPGIKIMKKLAVSSSADILKYKEFEGVADYFLFDVHPSVTAGAEQRTDWKLIDSYDGATPFLIGGDITLDDMALLKTFHHPRFLGVNLNEQVEDAPALKNIERLEAYINKVR